MTINVSLVLALANYQLRIIKANSFDNFSVELNAVKMSRKEYERLVFQIEYNDGEVE